jgi:uncharacterized protein YvpB
MPSNTAPRHDRLIEDAATAPHDTASADSMTAPTPLPHLIYASIGICALVAIVAAVLVGISRYTPELHDDDVVSAGTADDTAAKAERMAPASTETDRTLRRSSDSALPVPYISQFPDLPTGCEVTAATMALDYCGFDAAATDVDEYLAKDETFSADPDTGELFGPDPDEVFIGDTASEDGMFCNPQPIVNALNAYIEANGGGYRAAALEGEPVEHLFSLISSGTPVIVWVTIDMQADYPLDAVWTTSSGAECFSSTQFHAMVLTGYDEDEGVVYVNDPIDGDATEYPLEDFIASYESRGKLTAIVQKI